MLIHAVVHAADLQDRDGGELVMATLFGMFPFLLKLYADGGYQGPLFRTAVKKVMKQVNVEIVKRSDTAKGFVCRFSRRTDPGFSLRSDPPFYVPWVSFESRHSISPSGF